MKKITLYSSTICPRCYMAANHLRALQKQYGDFQIEEVDIITHPLRTWHEKIRMVPALRINDQTLSGFYLSRKAIKNFINKGIDPK